MASMCVCVCVCVRVCRRGAGGHQWLPFSCPFQCAAHRAGQSRCPSLHLCTISGANSGAHLFRRTGRRSLWPGNNGVSPICACIGRCRDPLPPPLHPRGGVVMGFTHQRSQHQGDDEGGANASLGPTSRPVARSRGVHGWRRSRAWQGARAARRGAQHRTPHVARAKDAPRSVRSLRAGRRRRWMKASQTLPAF